MVPHLLDAVADCPTAQAASAAPHNRFPGREAGTTNVKADGFFKV